VFALDTDAVTHDIDEMLVYETCVVKLLQLHHMDVLIEFGLANRLFSVSLGSDFLSSFIFV